ncbi:MAG: SlyX family protein [Alphaproteobacteria bacterium]
MQQQIINIEIAITNMQNMLDDLNDVVITQGKEISALKLENKRLAELINQSNIKSPEEETPPPHY